MANLPTQPKAEPTSTRATTAPALRWNTRLIIGIVLMTSSFLVYPAYPVILLWLPLSSSAKATVSIAAWVLSWSAFSLGTYLAGPQGYAWFKGLWAKLIKGRRGLAS